MATSTTNLGLTKPSVNDAADIGVLNSNFDKIDTKCNPALFAPSGYGLGEIRAPFINTTAQVNAIRAFGLNEFYSTSETACEGVSGLGQGSILTIPTMYAVTQYFFCRYPYSGCVLKRISYVDVNDGWNPWEWVNPPMSLGIEYRTTERWQGKPVYAKLLDAGYLPNASSKVLDGVIQSGIDELVALECTFSGVWTKKTHDPRIDLTMGVEQPYAWVTITTTADLSQYTGRVLIKWTRPD